ncbi:MAG: TrkH family potassium uptake protein [Oscillospiraceae bacterium]
MNHKLVAKVLGAMLCVEGVALLLPAVVSMLYQDGSLEAFMLTAVVSFAVGLPLASMNTAGLRMQRRDGFACVGLCWILLGAVGALPYVISGAIPRYVDALFETISGFTTTGASILSAVEGLPKGILFWRSLTNWMGGMGVLVLILALLPKLGDGSVNLMRAESPGPVLSKLVPRVADTAKILYVIYIGLTALETVALCLLGMPLFDSLTHSFATIATGGFSVRNTSIAYYGSDAINWTVTLFMFLAGTNFSLLFLVARRRFSEVARSEELRLYSGVVLGSITLMALDLTAQMGLTLGQAVSQAAFQTMTVVTTTGFATADFAAWPAASQCILILLMLVGGCAGSTAGGLKCARVLLLFKSMRRWLLHILHPREVHPIRMDGRSTEENTVTSTACFFFAYILILLACTVVIALDEVPFLEAFTAALSALSNVGPALGAFGPTGCYASLSDLSKLAMSFAMLLGRLEIVPLLILLFPSIWRRR